MKITKTTISQIKSLRNEYFYSMPHFQELYLELMVSESDIYLLLNENDVIGYLVVNNEGVLVEFYVKADFIPDSKAIFNAVLSELSIKKIYCKSFDALLLSNCMLNDFSYSVIGVLYRDYPGARVERDVFLQMQRADLSYKDLILSQDDSLKELYETEELLVRFIENEHVFVFYKNTELMGYGMVIRTHHEWDFCDLGVWVHPEKRGCSYGAQILLNLREFALDNNLKPSCGCAVDNIASQKTIEKSGFVSRYKLIEFEF